MERLSALSHSIIIGFIVVFLSGCSSPEFGVTEASALIIKGAPFPRVETEPLINQVTIAQWQSNHDQRNWINQLVELGLLQVTRREQQMVITLTTAGSEYGTGGGKEKITLSLGEKVLDRVDSISEPTDHLGPTVRDVFYTWHYSKLTPFGQAKGLEKNQPKQHQTAFMLFGDGWRYMEK